MIRSIPYLTRHNDRQNHACGFRVTLILTASILFQTFAVSAQDAPTSELTAWIYQQKAQLQERYAKHKLRETEAQQALDQSLYVLSLAEHLEDGEAARVAREAITISRTALARIRAAEHRDQSRLIAVNKVSEFKSRWRELRLASPTGVSVPDESKGEIAVVSAFKGVMEIKTSMGWARYHGDFPLIAGDEIRTGPGGYAEIMFPGGSLVNLDANSSFQAAKLDEKEFVYDKIMGRIHAAYQCIKEGGACRYQRYLTKSASIGIRGTEFQMEANPDGRLTLIVIDGVVEIKPLKGGNMVKMQSGQKAVVTKAGDLEGLSPANLKELQRWWEVALQE